MLVVSIRNAVCVLGRFPALAGADLDVETEEIVWLSGPNGAGKTTLLKVIAGLLPLTRGSVEVFGHDLAADRRFEQRRVHRRRIALVGHAAGGYDDLTVDENLRFAARSCGAADESAARARAAFDLEPIASVRHVSLSAGQRRRLTLAMAFARDADLLLLDEPHAGLDAAGRERLDAAVVEFASGGRSVVFASHEVDRASALHTREVAVIGGTTRNESDRRLSGDRDGLRALADQ